VSRATTVLWPASSTTEARKMPGVPAPNATGPSTRSSASRAAGTPSTEDARARKRSSEGAVASSRLALPWARVMEEERRRRWVRVRL
jgi:hypothetical protein